MGKHTRRKVDIGVLIGTWESARTRYTKPSHWAWLKWWMH